MKKTWLKIKNQVLGEKYDLSFSYAGNDEMQRLNNLYRQKIIPPMSCLFPCLKMKEKF